MRASCAEKVAVRPRKRFVTARYSRSSTKNPRIGFRRGGTGDAAYGAVSVFAADVDGDGDLTVLSS